MENLEATYKSLISVENLDGLTAEEALEHIGLLTDVSFDLRLTEGLKCAIQLSEELQKRQLNAGQLATLHYFVANAWAYLRKLERSDKDKSWEWEQKETEKEIIHLRLALDEEGLRQLPDERICQILTNLSNHMDYVGRFVEAVEYRDRALAKLPSHSMARGNRGRGLVDYARSLYDQGHVALFLKHAYSDIKIALFSALHEGARNYFDMYRMNIESVMSPEHLNEVFDMCAFPLGSSEQEIQYRQWCLNNTLFLNPLNDLGPFPIAAQDILTPSIVMDIDKGPYYFGYFNQIKQEFVSARYLYYEGINAKNLHFSDKQVLLYKTRLTIPRILWP
jgi:tetratricopeptide (TPR) repeat protein